MNSPTTTCDRCWGSGKEPTTLISVAPYPCRKCGGRGLIGKGLR